MPHGYLAIDLGASSGRAILGVLDGEPKKLELVELHRFEHDALPTPTGPVWNLGKIWTNILRGLEIAANHCKANCIDFVSVGVDTWGVDWALLGDSGELLSLPHCYRDPQNDAACQEVLSRVGGVESLYERTGIQLMSINTLFQVYARHQKEPRLLQAARHLVFLPDLFHFWLSGKVSVERSIASTSSMLNAGTGDWDKQLLSILNIPTHLLGQIVEPGTTIGTITNEVAKATSAPANLKIVLPAAHDTGSAVAAVPAGDDSWAYLSSGTWSLLGVETEQPDTSIESLNASFTNESGFDGCTRYLKNITGLWLIQELRREFVDANGQDCSFQVLVDLARAAPAFETIINPNYPDFGTVGNMTDKIKRYARETGQAEPETIGGFARCCFESLAICYRATIEELEANLSTRINSLHIVGGGSQNKLLNTFVSNATGRPVFCGPVECSSIGNILIQATGKGGQAKIRDIVRRSFPITEIVADESQETWNAALERFRSLQL